PDGAIPRRVTYDPETKDIELTFRVDWFGRGKDSTEDLTLVLELDDSW
ncbi:MAG: hypothetical protein GY762_10470, partial [Proteobacteria bacterium]|nr:hypothetical protein [Pseudomonadota bacterium]